MLVQLNLHHRLLRLFRTTPAVWLRQHRIQYNQNHTVKKILGMAKFANFCLHSGTENCRWLETMLQLGEGGLSLTQASLRNKRRDGQNGRYNFIQALIIISSMFCMT